MKYFEAKASQQDGLFAREPFLKYESSLGYNFWLFFTEKKLN